MEKIDNLCIVDDDKVFQFLTQKVADKSNLVNKYEFFTNGEEAINHIKSVIDQPENLPDVILLDLAMPIMDGWDFLNEYLTIKSDIGKQIFIYIVTSSIDPSDREKAKTISEVTDFIVKPVTKEKFHEIVNNL